MKKGKMILVKRNEVRYSKEAGRLEEALKKANDQCKDEDFVRESVYFVEDIENFSVLTHKGECK